MSTSDPSEAAADAATSNPNADRGSVGKPPLAKRWRLARMGAATLLGLKPQGFFIPYRYAAGVAPPGPYAALEPLFVAAESEMRATLAAAESVGERLQSFRGAKAPAPRWEQGWFPRLDGAAAYALARTEPPRRVVEVGSGHSTRFIAKALADAGAGGEQVCIDPAPRAALKSLNVRWRAELLAPSHAPLFAALEPGDMAVFDSSHILMPGTDVDLIFNALLTSLAPGVRVHIHDIFLPDPYPASWAWRGYNEQNALGPLLASGAWRILFSSRYAATRLNLAALAPTVSALPIMRGAVETSLWLEKL